MGDEPKKGRAEAPIGFRHGYPAFHLFTGNLPVVSKQFHHPVEGLGVGLTAFDYYSGNLPVISSEFHANRVCPCASNVPVTATGAVAGGAFARAPARETRKPRDRLPSPRASGASPGTSSPTRPPPESRLPRVPTSGPCNDLRAHRAEDGAPGRWPGARRVSGGNPRARDSSRSSTRNTPSRLLRLRPVSLRPSAGCLRGHDAGSAVGGAPGPDRAAPVLLAPPLSHAP